MANIKHITVTTADMAVTSHALDYLCQKIRSIAPNKKGIIKILI
jgi:hypothetical protein